MPVLIVLSVTHLLNDMLQSLIPAIYPIIKQAYSLDFAVLWERGAVAPALGYAIGSVLLSLAAVFAGLMLMRAAP